MSYLPLDILNIVKEYYYTDVIYLIDNCICNGKNYWCGKKTNYEMMGNPYSIYSVYGNMRTILYHKGKFIVTVDPNHKQHDDVCRDCFVAYLKNNITLL